MKRIRSRYVSYRPFWAQLIGAQGDGMVKCQINTWPKPSPSPPKIDPNPYSPQASIFIHIFQDKPRDSGEVTRASNYSEVARYTRPGNTILISTYSRPALQYPININIASCSYPFGADKTGMAGWCRCWRCRSNPTNA